MQHEIKGEHILLTLTVAEARGLFAFALDGMSVLADNADAKALKVLGMPMCELEPGLAAVKGLQAAIRQKALPADVARARRKVRDDG